MSVYVLNVNGQPLMPTSRCGKVKHLLKDGKAKVVRRCPFTIQLTYECGNYTQPMTFGYITKNIRINNKLPKTHYVDARCISGNPNVKPLGYYYYQKKIRCHNRQIHKNTIQKGGYRKSNQAPKHVYGYQLFDKVKYNKQECFIFGRRSSGYFDVRTLDGTKLSAGVSYKNLELLEKRKTYLIERRRHCLPPLK